MTAAAVTEPQEDTTRIFTPIAALGMVVVGVFAFLAFVTLSAYAPDLRGRFDGGEHALSRSAIGFAGLVELLKADGAEVMISRGAKAADDSSTGLIILTPGTEASPDDVKAMGYPRPMLMILPKWLVVADPQRVGWVRKLEPTPLEGIARMARPWGKPLTIEQSSGVVQARLMGVDPAADPSARALPPIRLAGVENLRSLSGEGWVPALVDQRGKALVVRARDRALYVLADPDLLNNHGIKSLQAARAAVELIGRLRGGGPVVFDVTLNGYKRSRSLLKLVLEPPFLGATLCLLAAALLMALHAASRFGAIQAQGRTLALGKRALVDNSAGLIRMTRREPRMAKGYWLLNREAVARSVGVPPGLEGAELDAMLDRLSDKGEASILAAQAGRVRDLPGLMRAAQALYRWRMEMTREQR